jgi:hypothetical protein
MLFYGVHVHTNENVMPKNMGKPAQLAIHTKEWLKYIS